MRNPPKNIQKEAKTSKFKNLYDYEVSQPMLHIGIYKNNISLLSHSPRVSLSRNPFNGTWYFNFSFLSLKINMFFIISLSKNLRNFYGSLLKI